MSFKDPSQPKMFYDFMILWLIHRSCSWVIPDCTLSLYGLGSCIHGCVYFLKVCQGILCIPHIFKEDNLIKHRRIRRAYATNRLGLALPVPQLIWESDNDMCCLRGAQEHVCCLQCLALQLAGICNCRIKGVRSYIPAYSL